MNSYEYHEYIDGELVYFGFDGKRLSLFGGSYEITFPQIMSYAEVVEDLKHNYATYKEEDLLFTYQAFGYYD